MHRETGHRVGRGASTTSGKYHDSTMLSRGLPSWGSTGSTAGPQYVLDLARPKTFQSMRARARKEHLGLVSPPQGLPPPKCQAVCHSQVNVMLGHVPQGRCLQGVLHPPFVVSTGLSTDHFVPGLRPPTGHGNFCGCTSTSPRGHSGQGSCTQTRAYLRASTQALPEGPEAESHRPTFVISPPKQVPLWAKPLSEASFST